MSNVQHHIEELRVRLHAANESYYVDDSPTMPDTEFDRLMVELKQLELQHPEYADPNSPTVRVGGRPIEGFTKAKHQVRMLSLDNAFTPEDVLRFFGKPVNVVMEPKIDGLSLSLRYVDGALTEAVTRGNGDEGDMVTENARTIRTIPLVLPEPLTIEVRGEVYLARSRFEALNAEREAVGEDLFANPRNAASGTMKLKDSRDVAKRQLSFCAYRLIGNHVGIETRSETQDLRYLKFLGFETPLTVPVQVADGLSNKFSAIKQIAVQGADGWKHAVASSLEWLDKHRKHFDMDTDGAVFKIDSLQEQSALNDGTKSVSWAVAFKYPPERKATLLLDVVLTVGRTGQITPNARLQPVQLGGSTVKAASLCNADEIERLGINVGDEVYVEKAAEIIPQLSGLARKRSPGVWKMPQHCPSCDTKLERCGVHYFCPCSDCPDQVMMRLKYATAKAALDWDGMGESQVLSLYAQGFSTLSDLFTKTPSTTHETHPLTPAQLKKFMAERERVKKVPLWRQLTALGIENVGATLCKELAQRYRSIEAIAAAPKSELTALLGPVACANLVAFIDLYADEIDRLSQAGMTFKEEGVAGPLSGKEFVITGTMTSGSRSQVAAKIEAAGGLVKGSVSKKTNFLVVGIGGGNNKSAAAAKHGTVTISEQELFAMLGVDIAGL